MIQKRPNTTLPAERRHLDPSNVTDSGIFLLHHFFKYRGVLLLFLDIVSSLHYYINSTLKLAG